MKTPKLRFKEFTDEWQENKEVKINIQDSFGKTLQEGNLSDLCIDGAEFIIDDLLHSDIPKEIPIVKTIIAFAKLGISINDRLFLKKLIMFLNQIHDIKAIDRKKMIEEIDNSNNFRIKVGEKIFYLIDKSDDWITADLIGRLFKLLVSEKIGYKEFIVCSEIVSKVSNQDLTILKENKKDGFEPNELSSLTASGLLTLEFDQGNILNEGGPLGTWGTQDANFKVVDSGVYYAINDYGKIVRSIL